jgi:integrase
MARYLIPSDATIRATKPHDKPFRLNDGDGLYLLIRSEGGPKGGWWWRFDYSFHGRRKTLSLGTYPDTGLQLARRKADEARKLVEADTDPSDIRKADKAKHADQREAERRKDAGIPPVNSFEAVAREWYETRRGKWAPSHSDKVIARLEADAFPWIGARPVGEIRPGELRKLFERVHERGALETAHRVLQHCGQVFRYAVFKELADRDPTRDMRGHLTTANVKHMPAITEPAQVGELLRAIDAFNGTYIVKYALRLAPLLFVRPGELRTAEWRDFDLERAEWNIPAERMKSRAPHLVPLATQAVAILRDLHPLTGHRRFVFPGARSNGRPMSNAAVNAALRRLGYDTRTEITGHGFRAMARTILHEELAMDRDVIEHQLAHRVPDALGTAYNRTKFLKQRRAMMQTWADYLDRLKDGAKVIPLRQGVV